MSQPALNPSIQARINETLFCDTHEHLLEESQRISGPSPDVPLFSCDDWAYLFAHYALDDLRVAGMTERHAADFVSTRVSPQDKWKLFSPYWPYIRQTGYGRAVSLTIQRLFGIDDISSQTVTLITDKLRSGVQKGYYYRVLREVAGVETCQVNSLDRSFRQAEYPDLMLQDLSTIHMGSELNVEQLRRETGLPVTTLDECYQAIDWYFESYGQQAVAVKNQSAYSRRLDYLPVSREYAAPLFERYASDPATVATQEVKAIQDHLWRYSVQRATEYRLAVKLHTGYFAGTGYMPLDRVSQNLKDLCPILQDFPDTQFVLMHITYPYQDELIALAKHYRNVYVDLCWAWIVNPIATKRFVKEFLMAVPANKLFTFGGDYTGVENVVGHAEIARRGLAQALSELISEDWISENEALGLVEPLMRQNANEFFHVTEKTKGGASR